MTTAEATRSVVDEMSGQFTKIGVAELLEVPDTAYWISREGGNVAGQLSLLKDGGKIRMLGRRRIGKGYCGLYEKCEVVDET